ncbi:hypothetical protein OAQ45_00925 [Candidatus Marinimicrobia bacterium]|nr:hypothetical protein [Candidatus Neomarinimicrobiota bacterium]
MKLLQSLQKLKEGIETGNNALIEEGYSLLTGEEISFPTNTPEPEGVEGSLGKIIGVLKDNVEILEMDFTMDKDKTNAKKKEFVNKFDPGLDADEEDGYDLINDNVKPVQRKRKAHKNVKVFCQDCQKNIEVDPQFKKEPYFCDFIKLGQKCPVSQ